MRFARLYREYVSSGNPQNKNERPRCLIRHAWRTWFALEFSSKKTHRLLPAPFTIEMVSNELHVHTYICSIPEGKKERKKDRGTSRETQMLRFHEQRWTRRRTPCNAYVKSVGRLVLFSVECRRWPTPN